MEKKYEAAALGELLIDFVPQGTDESGSPLYKASAGGAPGNVMAMMAKLGYRTQFIGKVGRDGFGDQLKQALARAGVGTDGLCTDEEVHTTLAFVHHSEDGERSFSFYRNPGADMMLREDEIPYGIIEDSRILHFGSLSLTDEPVRSATHAALCFAEEKGILRSYDPNLRPALWRSAEAAKEQIGWGLEHCDILKISDDELRWFTGKQTVDEGVQALRARYSIELIAVTMGSAGSCVYIKDLYAQADGFPVRTVDTTGAGDTFCGCLLDGVLRYGLDGLNAARLHEILRYANAAAAYVVTKKGALPVMPDVAQIQEILRQFSGK